MRSEPPTPPDAVATPADAAPQAEAAAAVEAVGNAGSTADQAQADAEAVARLGAHIRRIRKARGLTLVQVAKATNLSHPFLSQLERGLAQPSLSTLRRIALALETSPIELIGAAGDLDDDGPDIEVHRRGEQAVDGGFGGGAARMLARANRPFLPVEISGDSAEGGDTYVHAEDEFAYVLEGDVVIELAGERYTAAVGDSIYYRGGVPHRWWSVTGEPFRLLVVKRGTGEHRNDVTEGS